MITIKPRTSLHIKQFKTYVLCIVVLLLIIFSLYSVTKKPKLDLSFQEQAINLNPNLLKMTSLGQSRLLSSLLWIETLLNSDTTHYDQDNLQNWMYLRFNTITELDPKFYEAYLYGGIYLSIIKDDDQGALHIYEKGLQHFPDDYYLNLNASFHYFYELGDIDKSLISLQKIYKNPLAPSYLPTLYARLQSSKGDLKSAMTLLFDLYRSSPKGSNLQKSYAQKLYALKAEIDLDCLNSHKKKCAQRDFYGEKYQRLDSGEYKAQLDWKPFKIKKRPNSSSAKDK